MDQIKLAEFAKNSENKENPDEFTPAVQEAGIAQGSLIVSPLYNTMLGELTRVLRSWNAELVKVLAEAGITPSALTNEQLYAALLQLIRKNSSGLQLGDLIANIGTTSPAGRVLCNGQRLTNCKTIFPEFYEYVTTNTPYKTVAEWNSQTSMYGQCGFCAVDGDDIIVPLITRPISGVSNLNQCGQAILDTMRPLSGIVATIHLPYRGTVPTSNPFYVTDTVWTNVGQDGDAGNMRYTVRMDTSRLGARYAGTETRGKQVQYPYYIQVYTAVSSQSIVNVAELISLLKMQNQVGIVALPQQGGTITLSSGGIYTVTLSENTVFTLPNPEDKSLLNQILIQMRITGENITINWGTSVYFSAEPSSGLGSYNIVYEYDSILNAWTVGQVEKVTL